MLGRMKKVFLRQVWENEAKDFTTWLYENLEVLGEELNIELTAIEKEKRVGTFSADIIAAASSGGIAVIENQLEKTDHTHLGQILTYVTNLKAEIAIWISSEPRDEHVKAIEWLNECATDARFYLVKIEAYRIDQSLPAAKFTVVTGPSEASDIVREEKREMTGRRQLNHDFWESFIEKSKDRVPFLENLSPGTDPFIRTSAGIRGLGINPVIAVKYGQVELYIDRGPDSGNESTQIFDYLFEHKEEIEQVFGDTLDWERLDNSRASRIKKCIEFAGINDKDKWPQLQEMMIDAMVRLEKALRKHIDNLKPTFKKR